MHFFLLRMADTMISNDLSSLGTLYITHATSGNSTPMFIGCNPVPEGYVNSHTNGGQKVITNSAQLPLN
jgi:hypothetical protein